jgi:hypothetical protein
VNPLTIVGGIALLFFLPGFLLLHALFPGRRYFGPFHPFALPLLSLVVSVALVVVVGTALAFLPGSPPGSAPGRGWFQGSQSASPDGQAGVPVLEVTLGSLSLLLFGVAAARGAFPLLGRKREYENAQERGEPEDVTILRDLRLEEERLRKEASRIRRRAEESRDPGVRSALSGAAADLERDRRTVAGRARDVEKRAGERRYGNAEGFSGRPR